MTRHERPPPKLSPKGVIRSPSDVIGLPSQFQPSLAVVNINATYMVSYLLEDGKTAVVSYATFFTCNH
jgi:hypothetical protein